MKKKIFWFSRHQMTQEQLAALGECEIVQYSATIEHASEVAEYCEDCDVLAIVAPVGLQSEFLRIAGDRPVIMAQSERIITPVEGGEDEVKFVFRKWERLIRINIVKEDYIP